MPTSIDHMVLCPIDNFQMNIPEVILSEGLSIVQIDHLPEEYQGVFGGTPIQTTHKNLHGWQTGKLQRFTTITYETAPNQVLARTLELSNCVMRWHFKGKIPDPFNQHYALDATAQEHFDRVLAALRLMKSQIVGLFPEDHFLTSDLALPEKYRDFMKHTRIAHHTGYRLSDPGRTEPYIFDASDTDTLKKLVAALRQAHPPRLDVAVTRLESQYTRASIADRVIDAVIGLEALYIDQGQSELQNRIALRAAAHLGAGNPDLRERIFLTVKTAYDLRSKIVHGEIHTPKAVQEFKGLKSNWVNSDDLLEAITDLLRQALQSVFLSTHKDGFKTFHKRLERAIQRGETFQV